MPPTTKPQGASPNAAGPGHQDQDRESREAIINRQREHIDNLLREAANEPQRRAVVIDELASTRTRLDELEDLRRLAGDTDGHVREIRQLEEKNSLLINRLYELVQEGLEDRQRGGRNAGLRMFADDRDAADYAVRAMLGNPELRDMFSRVEWLGRQVESVRKADERTRALTGEEGAAGDDFAPITPARQIIGMVDKFTTAMSEARVVPIPEAGLEEARRGARARAFRTARAAAATESELGEPTRTKVMAQEYIGLTFVHQALLADQQMLPAIGDLIAEDHADGIAQLLERDVVLGVAGAADAGLGFDPGAFWFDGFLNDANVAAVTIASGTNFDQADFLDYLALAFGIQQKVPPDNLKFHFHRTQLQNLMGRQDTQGRFIWQPPTESAPGFIWGWPYNAEWRSMPTTAQAIQADQPFAIFGDLRRAYTVGVRQSFEFRTSEHVRFIERQVGMMGIARFAAKMSDDEAIVKLKTNAA